MGKKLLETKIGNGNGMVFVYKGQRVDASKLPAVLLSECKTSEVNIEGGVIVYFSKKEYEQLRTHHYLP